MHQRWSRAACALALSCHFTCSGAAEDDVLVTATRFPERRLDAPIGTRVISGHDIAQSTARTLPELLGQLGGLHVRNNSGSPDLQLDLRGFGVNGDQNTLVLLDGIRLNEEDLSTTRLSSIPLEAIERIEILPGGGAVQYGGGATGGTINIITRGARPDAAQFSAFAGAGSYDTLDLRAGGSVATDRFGLGLYGSGYDSENYRRNNAVRQQNVAGDLRWTRDDDSVVLRLGMDRQDLRLPGALTEAQIAADPRQAASPDDFSLKDGGFATLAGSMRLDAFTLAADLGYRDTRAAAFFKDNAFGLFDAYIETRLARVVFSPRVRWQGELFGASQNVVVGYDWSDWDWDRRTAANAAALGSPTAETTSAQTNGALYAQWFGDVAPRLRANLGWREQRTETELRTLIPAPQTMQQQVLGLSAGEAGLRFAVTEPTALLARVTKSFRVATVEENGFTLTGRLLQPQTAIGYDAGVEHRAPGRMLRAVGYQIDLENEIYFSPLSGTFGVNMNLPPTRRRGIELAASAQAASSLELGGSLIVQQARFREGVFNGVDVAGNDIPLVPRVLANLRATWEFVPRARLGANYTFVGRQRYDNDQANRFREMPTYGLFDLKASYEVQGFTLAATIANLFDVAYYNYGIVNSATNPTTFNAYPQAGRTYFASIEYRFR